MRSFWFRAKLVLFLITASLPACPADVCANDVGYGSNSNSALETARSGISGAIGVAIAVIYIIGALYLIVGIVRLVMSYSHEDGPDQQKAVMMILTGILLFFMGTVAMAFPGMGG